MTSTQGHGQPNPTYIPVAYDAVRRMAEDHQGHARRQRRRALQPPADRALHRRLHDRRLPADRRRRRLPADVRPRGAARRRRVGRLGQPRRQPVADHHRPGRARDGLLAQQGRGRRAARARRRRTPGSRRWHPRTRSSRRPRRGPCGCPSWASADPARSFSRRGRNPAPQGSLARMTGPAVMLPPSWPGPSVQALSTQRVDHQGPDHLPPRSGPEVASGGAEPCPGEGRGLGTLRG